LFFSSAVQQKNVKHRSFCTLSQTLTKIPKSKMIGPKIDVWQYD